MSDGTGYHWHTYVYEFQLTDIGFDLSAFEKMYGKEKIELGIWFAKDLKDRYTVLWLYDELFLNDELLKKLQNHQAEKI